MIDRKTMMTVLIMLGIFIGWEKFYMEPRRQAQQVTANPVAMDQKAAESSQPVAPGNIADSPEQVVAIDLGKSVLKLSNRAKLFKNWELKGYREGLDKTSKAIDLVDVSHQKNGLGDIVFDRPEYLYLDKVSGTLAEAGDRVTWTYQDANIKIVRTVNKPAADAKVLDFDIDVEFFSAPAKNMFVSIASESKDSDADFMDRRLVHYSEKAFNYVDLKGTIEQAAVPFSMNWIGATNRYFLFSILKADSSPATGLIQGMSENKGRIMFVYPASGNRVSAKLKAFFGPKELGTLRKVDPTLEQTIDFGWFTLFAYPLLRFMKLLNDLVSNWGVAIILLTLAVKLLTFPLTYKSMVSMKQMAKLNPQIQKLKEKYGDDKEALNREMMMLMKTQGYNPLAGCLPILIQMPVFFALYRVLYSSTELYQAPFMFWIQDLSAKDPFYITPVLLTAVMFVQQKITPTTATDPVQAKMLQWMPVIFGVFMLQLPAGLTLYMLVNAIAGIGQQVLLNKKLDTGNATPATA